MICSYICPITILLFIENEKKQFRSVYWICILNEIEESNDKPLFQIIIFVGKIIMLNNEFTN